jgi:hypothetical protein
VSSNSNVPRGTLVDVRLVQPLMNIATPNLARARPSRLLAAALLVVAVLLAGCGDDGVRTDTGNGGPSENPDPTAAVQVLVAGGFTTPENAASTVPTVTVLTDGTVITQAAVPAIYPGPAIPPLQRSAISAEQVDELLEVAGDLGLLRDDLDFGEPPVVDAPDTTVTIVAGDATYVHVARALGFGGGLEDGGLEDEGAGGLTEEQRANRAALRDFLSATEELPAGEESYVPDAVVVTVIGPYQADELPQEPRAWPLETLPDLDGNFPCTVFTGDDAVDLLAALGDANQRTPWLIDGEELTIAFRPAVPGYSGCDQSPT